MSKDFLNRMLNRGQPSSTPSTSRSSSSEEIDTDDEDSLLLFITSVVLGFDDSDYYLEEDDSSDSTSQEDSSDSSDSESGSKTKMEVESKEKIMKRYIRLSTPTNVIVLNHQINHIPLNRIMEHDVNWTADEVDVRDGDDDEVRKMEGPYCHLCGQEAVDDCSFVLFNDIRYTIIYKDTFTSLDHWMEEFIHEVGFLQCCYCFNYFHRMRCSLSMSDKSYLNFKISKQWACTSCVPAFIPTTTRKLSLAEKTTQILVRVVNRFKPSAAGSRCVIL